VLWSIVGKEGKPRAELEKGVGPSYKLAFANAMKKKVLAIKDDKVTRTVENLVDTDQRKLRALSKVKY